VLFLCFLNGIDGELARITPINLVEDSLRRIRINSSFESLFATSRQLSRLASEFYDI